MATTADHLERADVVFTGTLVESRLEERTGPRFPMVRHLFDVDRVLVGELTRQATVRSESLGASCGLELLGDGPFVVFAEGPDERGGPLDASLCGGTAELTPEFAAELDGLIGPAPPTGTGEGVHDPIPAAGPVDADEAGWTPGPIALAAGVAAALVAGGLVALPSRRRSRR